MLIRVGYIGDDPQERDFHFVSKDFSELPSITVKILQKKFKYYDCTIETFIDFLKFMSFIIEDENFNKAAGESLSDEEAVIISISQLEEYAGQIQKNVNDIMKKLNLPESVIGSGNGNGSYMQDVFHVTGNAQVTMKNIMAAAIASKLAGLALNAIIYIAVYLVVFAILKIVFAVTGVVGRLPLIYQANKLLGLAFGIIEGLVIVWLLFAVITACSNMQWAAKALIEIGKNDLLSLIYNHNFIIKTITKTV